MIEATFRVDEVLIVKKATIREDGMQDITWGHGFGIGFPPIEYTFKPGDVLEVQWGGAWGWGGSMQALRINGSPVLQARQLWAAYLEEWEAERRRTKQSSPPMIRGFSPARQML